MKRRTKPKSNPKRESQRATHRPRVCDRAAFAGVAAVPESERRCWPSRDIEDAGADGGARGRLDGSGGHG